MDYQILAPLAFWVPVLVVIGAGVYAIVSRRHRDDGGLHPPDPE